MLIIDNCRHLKAADLWVNRSAACGCIDISKIHPSCNVNCMQCEVCGYQQAEDVGVNQALWVVVRRRRRARPHARPVTRCPTFTSTTEGEYIEGEESGAKDRDGLQILHPVYRIHMTS